MPYIRGRHDGRSAIIDVAIIDAAKHVEHKQSENPVLSGVIPFKALVDTGATTTMITTKVVSCLGLQPVNKIPFSGLGGLMWRPAYLFHVAFYSLPPADVREISRIQICTKVINGGEIADEHSFDVLLGMDVITTGELRVCKDSTFQFSW